jgi:hypothetical protein
MVPVQAPSTSSAEAKPDQADPSEEVTKECSKEASKEVSTVVTKTSAGQFPTFGNLPQQPISTSTEDNPFEKRGDLSQVTTTKATQPEVRELIRVREANVGVPQFGTTFTGTAATKKIVRVTTTTFGDEADETIAEREITAERSTSAPVRKTYSRQRTIVGAPTRSDTLPRSAPTLHSLRTMGTTTFENPGTNQSAFIVRGDTVTLPPAGMPMSTVLNTATLEPDAMILHEEDDAETHRTVTPRSPGAEFPNRQELHGWGKKPWSKTPKSDRDGPGRARRALSASKNFFLRKFSSKNSFESAAEEEDSVQDDLVGESANVADESAVEKKQNDAFPTLDFDRNVLEKHCPLDTSSIEMVQEVLEEVTVNELIETDELEPGLHLLSFPPKPEEKKQTDAKDETKENPDEKKEAGAEGEKEEEEVEEEIIQKTQEENLEAQQSADETQNKIVDDLVEDILEQVVSEELYSNLDSNVDSVDVRQAAQLIQDAIEIGKETESKQEEITEKVSRKLGFFKKLGQRSGSLRNLGQRSGSLRNLLKRNKNVEASERANDVNQEEAQVEPEVDIKPVVQEVVECEQNDGDEVKHGENDSISKKEDQPEDFDARDVPIYIAPEEESVIDPQSQETVTQGLWRFLVGSPTKDKAASVDESANSATAVDPEKANSVSESPTRSLKAGSVDEGSVVNELEKTPIAETPNTKRGLWKMLQRAPTWAKTPDATETLATIHAVQDEPGAADGTTMQNPCITITDSEGSKAESLQNLADTEQMEVVVEVDGQEIVLLTSNGADGEVENLCETYADSLNVVKIVNFDNIQ